MFGNGTLQMVNNYLIGSAIRKIIHITNAIEGIYSSFRKVTKNGELSNENAFLFAHERITCVVIRWLNSKLVYGV